MNHQYDKSSDYLHRTNLYIRNVLLSQVNMNSSISSLWDIEVCKGILSPMLDCDYPVGR